MTGSSIGIWKILVAYAKYKVQNARINIGYRSWLLKRNGKGKCVLRFYFASVYFLIKLSLFYNVVNVMEYYLSSTAFFQASLYY